MRRTFFAKLTVGPLLKVRLLLSHVNGPRAAKGRRDYQVLTRFHTTNPQHPTALLPSMAASSLRFTASQSARISASSMPFCCTCVANSRAESCMATLFCVYSSQGQHSNYKQGNAQENVRKIVTTKDSKPGNGLNLLKVKMRRRHQSLARLQGRTAPAVCHRSVWQLQAPRELPRLLGHPWDEA